MLNLKYKYTYSKLFIITLEIYYKNKYKSFLDFSIFILMQFTPVLNPKRLFKSLYRNSFLTILKMCLH